MRTVLVTGGAGYIGSHVARTLARDGFLPIVLDNLSTGNSWAVKWGPFVKGDVMDADLVGKTVKKHRVEAVIHLAASAYVGESVANPRKYYRNNVIGSLEFFDALLKSGIDKIVFSSSCAVYGDTTSLLIDEDHVRRPVNPYGESKLFVERALHGLDAAHGFRSVCLRYFNAAGADPEGEVGEAHDPETHMIPLAIEAALGARKSVAVFGTDYETPDGSAVRDYTHVCDLARAHVLALRYLADGGPSTSLNLGTGRGHSVMDVINTVEKVSGRRVMCDYRPRRQGDPSRLIASNRKAETVLGWRPQFCELRAMVSHAWYWRESCYSKATASSTSGGKTIRMSASAANAE